MPSFRNSSLRTLSTTALFGLLTISSGCTTTSQRLDAASSTKGRISAGVAIADLPDRCRGHMGRVIPKIGEKARWSQKRWEFSADAVDRQIDDCAGFYDDQKARLAKS